MSDNKSFFKRQRIRFVTQCLIERKKELEIQEYIYKETGSQVSLRTIYRDRKQINSQATQFFFLLAKDNDEYNQKLKNTIDSLEETLCDLKRIYKESTDILTKLKGR
jgi:nicotinic acid mononucleotide adenylyltransferase